MQNGFLFVNKGRGFSSFDIIRELRNKFRIKKFGHCGTLDPFADGLLILAFNNATRLLHLFLNTSKEYEVVVEFGKISNTFDSFGEISETKKLRNISKDEVEKIIKNQFFGKIMQLPPKFSAIKVDGERAYNLARDNVDFELKEREIEILNFDVLDFNWPVVSFRVNCLSGTYIRSLISDLGDALGVGAYCVELTRTKIRDFSLDLAKPVSDLNFEDVVSIEKVMSHFDHLVLDKYQYDQFLKFGVLYNKIIDKNGVVAFYEGVCVGILELKGENVLLRKRL